jgi:hypothetical protein
LHSLRLRENWANPSPFEKPCQDFSEASPEDQATLVSCTGSYPRLPSTISLIFDSEQCNLYLFQYNVYSFAIFVYLVSIVSGTRQTQMIVKSLEGGTITLAVGETHGNVIACLGKSTLKGSNSICCEAQNWLDRQFPARGFAPTATIVFPLREKRQGRRRSQEIPGATIEE